MTDQTPDSDSLSRDRSAAMAVADAHLSFGWWALFVFLMLGLVLEALHAFKFGYYLDSSNETRRLVWRLAHAHGTLIASCILPSLSRCPRFCSRRLYRRLYPWLRDVYMAVAFSCPWDSFSVGFLSTAAIQVWQSFSHLWVDCLARSPCS